VSSTSYLRIVVLLACHNRAAITKRFFESFNQSLTPEIEVQFVVVDDGSTDNTWEIISQQPFLAHMIKGTGEWYWAKSMEVAEASILEVPDGILWLNDDLVLNEGALQKLIVAVKTFPEAVLVGQVYDFDGDSILYGGYRKNSIHPLKIKLIETSETYALADTFNGNFVYVPILVRLAVGPIDGSYSHAYADCDYGYRVRNAGYEIRVIPGEIGRCEGNTHPKYPGRLAKVNYLLSKKRNPLKSQIHFFWKFTEKKYKFLIPIFLIFPLLKIIIINETR